MTQSQNFLTTVTANIDRMTIALDSGLYSFRADLVFSMDANSNGIYFGLNFPAIQRANVNIFGPGTASPAGTTTQVRITAQAAGSTAILNITSGTTIGQLACVFGNIMVTAPGNLVWNAKSEVANTTTRVWGSSMIICWRIGSIA